MALRESISPRVALGATLPKAARFRVVVSSPRDALGRASFTLHWIEREPGSYRRELAADGKPVGFRRAQVYRMNVESFVDLLRRGGANVTIEEFAP